MNKNNYVAITVRRSAHNILADVKGLLKSYCYLVKYAEFIPQSENNTFVIYISIKNKSDVLAA